MSAIQYRRTSWRWLLFASTVVVLFPASVTLASGHGGGHGGGHGAAESGGHGGGHGAEDGGGHGGGHGEADPHAIVEIDAPEDVKDRGVSLGEYRVRAYYPVEAQKSTVRFKLYAKVPKERFLELAHQVADRQHKLRDQMIIVTRMTPLALFNEPQLESFRRRILMRLHRSMPELEIEAIYVSDFQLEVTSL